MADIPDLPPVLEKLLEGGEHDAVGAYALDALPGAEQETFEIHLAGCGQCQSELVLLRQSASILRRALAPDELEGAAKPAVPLPPRAADPPPPIDTVDTAEAPPTLEGPASEEQPAAIDTTQIDTQPGSAPEAASTEVDEAVAAPGGEAPPAEAVATAEPGPETAAEATAAIPPRRVRPRGRVAPGMHASPAPAVVAAPGRASKFPWIVAALGLAIGIAAVVAALALAEMKGNLEAEIDFQNSQVAGLNAERDTYLQQTAAVTWNLEPTTLGAPNSTGVVYADPAGASAILSVTGMNPLASDQVYQVWYLPAGDGLPEPGPVFTVDSNGDAVLQISPDISTYQALAVTTEPAGGSEEATTDPVMQGIVSVQ